MEIKFKKIIPIKNFEKEIDFLAEKIRKIKLPSGFFDFLFYTLSELFINIKEHAQIEKGEIFLELRKNQCLIQVRDKGIGLRGSYLKRKIFPKDDFSAIEFALSGLSTKTFQERGFGLYSIRRLVGQLKGKMIVETGLAKAEISRDKINFKTLSKKILGTKIKIKTPISKTDFYKVIT